MRFIRIYSSHNHRQDGGRATHLMRVGQDATRALCGIEHPMMTEGPEHEFDVTAPWLSTDCKRCERSAFRLIREAADT